MGSLLFGEIVEPSTRALIDEDLEEYPDYVEILPKWEGNFEIPNEIDSLIFVESTVVKDLLYNCVFENDKPICTLTNGGIKIFSLGYQQFVIVYCEEKELNIGQIVDVLHSWISLSKTIYTITSDSTYNYQNPCFLERPSHIIRILSNCENNFNYVKLEQPNLLTGLGAGVLSSCIHQSMKKCTLFIIYVDKSQPHSFNGAPILEVFKKINLHIKNYKIKDRVSSESNLYM